MNELEFLSSIIKDYRKLKDTSCQITKLDNDELFVKSHFTIDNADKNHKLSEIFKKLPFGIIDKSVTGIGGTTLELFSERNSIIVEPLRAIAASKAAMRQHEFMYIGSACGIYKNRATDNDIKSYITNNKIKYKKFLVVADSLPKFISLLVTLLEKRVFSTYFLLIDEIDSFQCDSDFRSSLEDCLDIYKQFPYSNRALITATLLEFSDPFFDSESYCKIEYDKDIKRKIILKHTKTFELTIADSIAAIMCVYPDDDIVIACNSIDIALRVIQDLEINWEFEPEFIKVLCSNSNFEKADKYFGEIINETLPGRINFLTSAYFVGVDIAKTYSSIIVCSYKEAHTLLSESKIKQISGRCREEGGLLNEWIIYECPTYESQTELLKKEDLEAIANTYLNTLKCIENQYVKSPYLKEKAISSRKQLIKLSSYYGHKLIRQNLKNENVISYFNIDGFLDDQRVRQRLYSDKEQLKIALEKDNEVLVDDKDSHRVNKTPSESKLDKKIREQLRLDALDTLKLIGDDKEKLQDLKNEVKRSDLKHKIYDYYTGLLEFVDADFAYEKTEQLSRDRDSKAYGFLMEAIRFHAMDKTDNFKNLVLSTFPLNEKLTNENIQKKLIEIYTICHFPLDIIDTPTKAIKMFNCYFKVSTKRDNTKMVKGYNPKAVKLLTSEIQGKERAEGSGRYENFKNKNFLGGI